MCGLSRKYSIRLRKEQIMVTKLNAVLIYLLLGMLISFAGIITVSCSTTAKPGAGDNPNENTGPEQKIAVLIKQLGASDYQIREQAQKDLIESGIAALGELKKVTNSKDPEIRLRANIIIEKIEWDIAEKKWEDFINTKIIDETTRISEILKDRVICIRERRGDAPYSSYKGKTLSYALLPDYRFHIIPIIINGNGTELAYVYAVGRDGIIMNIGQFRDEGIFYLNPRKFFQDIQQQWDNVLSIFFRSRDTFNDSKPVF